MRLLILLFLLALPSFGAWSAGSSSSYNSLNKAERTYNQGVVLMMDKQFLDAEKKFRAALKRDKTGRKRTTISLTPYVNRALIITTPRYFITTKRFLSSRRYQSRTCTEVYSMFKWGMCHLPMTISLSYAHLNRHLLMNSSL